MESTKKFRTGLTALQDGDSCSEAMRAAARLYVRDGESLATFLKDLEAAHEVLDLPPPGVAAVKEASIAWADETLTVFDGGTYEDPLTGLSTATYARTRLGALYRTRTTVPDQNESGGHAVVIVSLFEADPAVSPSTGTDATLDRSLRQATVSETIRATFERCELVTALGEGRVLAVVSRDEYLDNRVDELGWLLRRRLPVRCAPRVLVEELPATETEACALLDDLTA